MLSMIRSLYLAGPDVFRPDARERGRELKALCAQFGIRSEEHTSELQSLMRISYAVFCLKKKNHIIKKCSIVYLGVKYTNKILVIYKYIKMNIIKNIKH